MNILYVTSEAVPFCKTGGLADVAGSLPQSLAANGDRVSVILPLYQSVADAWRDRLHFERYTYVRLAWRSLYCGLFSYERQGVTWYFVDNEQYFKRPELYGYYDDGERFAFFCRAVTELLPLLPEKPDVVHCNDWQTALVPIVRETGGLKDTVHAYEAWNGAGNGFSFTNYNAGDMCYVIGEAVDLYHQKPEAYKALRKRGMAEDFSWARSAKKYREIYDSICK